MKWINAEQKVTVTMYDEEHEEHHNKIMTVEEMLDTYTNEGCPAMYSNPERKTGKWIILPPCYEEICMCSNCKTKFLHAYQHRDTCPNCSARMVGDTDD